MSDLIGLIFIILLVVGALIALSTLGKPYEVTKEEFEKRAQEAPSLLSAGMMGLQKFLDPATERAETAQQDLREGRFEGEQESGDGNDTTPVEPKASD